MFCLTFSSYDGHNDTYENYETTYFFRDIEKAKEFAEKYYGEAPKEWKPLRIKRIGISDGIITKGTWNANANSFDMNDKQFANIYPIAWED